MRSSWQQTSKVPRVLHGAIWILMFDRCHTDKHHDQVPLMSMPIAETPMTTRHPHGASLASSIPLVK